MAQLCSCCNHPRRQDIDKAIVAGESNRSIARQFDVSKDAVARHRKAHIAPKVAKAAEARERVGADKLLEIMESLLSTSIGCIRDARASGDNRTALTAVRETRETAKVLLEVAGELDNGPVVQIIQNPQYQRIEAVIMQTLEPYPEARLKLVAALREVEE